MSNTYGYRPQTTSTQKLKKELYNSIKSEEYHREKLLQNYIDTKSLCNSKAAENNFVVKRTREYILQLAVQKLEKCVNKHYFNLRNEYFYVWRERMIYDIENEKKKDFLKYIILYYYRMKAVTKLELIAISFFERLQKFYYHKWYEVIQCQINYDKYLLANKSAILIQKTFRGYSAKKRVNAMKNKNYQVTRTNAAIKIEVY